jgi:hypothetical protein
MLTILLPCEACTACQQSSRSMHHANGMTAQPASQDRWTGACHTGNSTGTACNLPACAPAPTTASLPDCQGGGSSTAHGHCRGRRQCRYSISSAIVVPRARGIRDPGPITQWPPAAGWQRARIALAARGVLEWLQEQLVAWEVMLVLVG